MEDDKKKIDPKVHQQEIYNKIKDKNFAQQPTYFNGLNINNSSISKDNLNHLQYLSKITNYILVTPLEIIYKEQNGIFNQTSNERERCPVCLYEFYDKIISNDTKNIDLKDFEYYYSQELDALKLVKCDDHFFHIQCLIDYSQGKIGFKCPICQKIYGVIIGDMPDGTMTIKVDDKMVCHGHNHGTIIIKYSFKSGILNGKKYSGTSRINYIPNTKKGRILLGLLKIAFDRKLTFTIGTSVTTGKQNTVIWNGIHHKSDISGGASCYGYPDDTYFERVCGELAMKGVNIEDYTENCLEFLGLSLMYGIE